MSYVTVNAKEVKEIIQATFPGYKKHKAVIVPGEKVTFYDLNWSGGTRNEYRACTIDGRPLDNAYNMSAPAPWNNPFEGKEIAIPENMVVVQGGHFCGKTSTLFIHVHPANMPKLLTNPL